MDGVIVIVAIVALSISIVAIVAIFFGQRIRFKTNSEELGVETEFPMHRKED